MGSEGPEVEGDAKEGENPVVEGEEKGEEIGAPLPEISLCYVLDINNPKTLKLKGTIQGHEVVVMIDPVATQNFISFTMCKC